MDICIIQKDEKDEGGRYLYEEFKKKNFSKILLTDLKKLDVRMSPQKISIRCKSIFDWDTFVIRVMPSQFPFNYLVASILEKKSIVLPSSKAILCSIDRGLLSKAIFESGVLQPITYVSSSTKIAKKAAIKFNKFAIKFARHCGKGVAILEKQSPASEILDVFSGLAQPFCVQRFIKGDIIKVLIVGEEVIALREYHKKGEEKSNEGKKESVKLEENVKCEMLKLSKYLKSFLFEVDLVENQGRYFVIDVSFGPNLEMYADISGKNVASIFADFILKNYSEKPIA